METFEKEKEIILFNFLHNILVLYSQKITKRIVLLAFGVKLVPNLFLECTYTADTKERMRSVKTALTLPIPTTVFCL